MTICPPPKVLYAVAVLSCFSGCADKVQLPVRTSSDSGYPVIVRLVGRFSELTISAGPDGPLYSGTSADGTYVFTNLSLDALRNQQPAIYRQVHPAISADISALGASKE
jgi:hypothetical protein